MNKQTVILTKERVRTCDAGSGPHALIYGEAPSPFGLCRVCESPFGICYLSFATDRESTSPVEEIRRNWPESSVREDHTHARKLVDSIFKRSPVPGLLVRGTPFQIAVWNALLEIPAGETTSYGKLAATIGRPGASRAVGTAVGANPVAWLIPCHRVVPKSGGTGNYRWGADRKAAMIAWEAARV